MDRQYRHHPTVYGYLEQQEVRIVEPLDVVVPWYGGNSGVFEYVIDQLLDSFPWERTGSNIFVEIDGMEPVGVDQRIFEQLDMIPYVHVAHNDENKGFTANLNRGLRKSVHRYVATINTDVIVRRGWAETLMGALASCRAAGIVGPKILDINGYMNHAGCFGHGFHFGVYCKSSLYSFPREVEWVTGACMMIHREVIDEIGFFNEEFPMWGSDREYCRLARKHGYETLYYPFPVNHHLEGSTTDAIKDKWKDSPV